MSLNHGFNALTSTITHIQLPNGDELPEYKDYPVENFDECTRIVAVIARTYQAGVVAEGKRLSSLVNNAIYQS
jgi:hypothetical protein